MPKYWNCCELCGREFSMKRNLMAHLKTHNENCQKFPCNICSYEFSRNSTLKVHMKIHKETDIPAVD